MREIGFLLSWKEDRGKLWKQNERCFLSDLHLANFYASANIIPTMKDNEGGLNDPFSVTSYTFSKYYQIL